MSEFLRADEWNIVMDMPEYGVVASAGSATGHLISKALKVDELKRLRDVGVRTALEFVSWDRIETKRGRYDWSLPDEMVTRCRAAGMKAILMTPNHLPQWMPDDWWCWTRDGKAMRTVSAEDHVRIVPCLSPWNEDAQWYQNVFIRMVCERYKADDVLCIQSQTQDGEFILPAGAAGLYDPAALASFAEYTGSASTGSPSTGSGSGLPDVTSPVTQRWMYASLREVVIEQQRIYCESHPSRTVCMQLHPEYTSNRWQASGNMDIVEYWGAIQSVVKPDNCMHIFFTCFYPGMEERVMDYGARLQMRYGVDVLTGSEWPEGLRVNTGKAIEYGLRGLVTAPIHPFCARYALEEWMVEAFRDSYRRFSNAKSAKEAKVGMRVTA